MSPDRSRDSESNATGNPARISTSNQPGKDSKEDLKPTENKKKRVTGKTIVSQPDSKKKSKNTKSGDILSEAPVKGASGAATAKPAQKKASAVKSTPKKTVAKKTTSVKSTPPQASTQKKAAEKAVAAKRIRKPVKAEVPSEAKTALDNLMAAEAGAYVVKPATPSREPVYPSEAPPMEAPAQYGRSRIVLMARDSKGLYAYWEVSAIDRGRHRIGQPQGPSLLLRVHDLGEGMCVAGGLRGVDFDVVLGQYDTHAFLTIPGEGRCWYCEFGILNEKGDFVSLAISNAVKTPRRTLTRNLGEAGEVWMKRVYLQASARPGHVPAQFTPDMTETASEDVFRISGGYQPQVHVDGSRQLVLEARPPVAFLLGASEQLPIPGVPTGVPVGLPTSGAIGQPVGHERERGFWLRVNTELIVYGQTEPDACLRIQGMPVALEPDGSFRIQCALPDGEHVIAVEAKSADGGQTRSVTPVVTRQTKDIKL